MAAASRLASRPSCGCGRTAASARDRDAIDPGYVPPWTAERRATFALLARKAHNTHDFAENLARESPRKIEVGP